MSCSFSRLADKLINLDPYNLQTTMIQLQVPDKCFIDLSRSSLQKDKNTGWTLVQRTDKINYDLENSPLQIRTNSKAGSNEKMKVTLYTASGSYAGAILLYFSSFPEYSISQCTSKTNFPTDLPSETDKVWTISLKKTSSEIRVVVSCNEKEVLNLELSDTVCSHDSYWNNHWRREVKKIEFDYTDLASDFYRTGKQ